MKESPDNNEWVKRLSLPGTVLFEQITTSPTRSLGNQLLFVSFLALLLSIDFLVITEGNVGIFKFKLSSYFNIIIVMAVSCLYFLLSYWFALFRDYKTSQYFRLPAVVEHRRLRDELVIALNSRFERAGHLAEEIERLIAIRKMKRDEIELNTDKSRPVQDDELEELENWNTEYNSWKLKMDEYRCLL